MFSLLKRETYTFPAVVEKRKEKRKNSNNKKRKSITRAITWVGLRREIGQDLLSEFSEHISNIKLDTMICIELNSPKF